MTKVWKWIIGVVLGLVILAVLVGVGFMLRSNYHVNRLEALDSHGFFERGPGMMSSGRFEHMRSPGMMGNGMLPFGGFFGGLLSLAFLALVVLGIIWLVRSLRTQKPVIVPAVIPAEMPAAIVNPCKKCGNPLQDAWKVCPHCGRKV